VLGTYSIIVASDLLPWGRSQFLFNLSWIIKVGWVEWLKKNDISLKVLGFAPNRGRIRQMKPNIVVLAPQFQVAQPNLPKC